MPKSSLRWILVIMLVLGAIFLWRSGLPAELSLASLKAQQTTLQTWIALHPWLAVWIFSAIYISISGLSLPGSTILTLTAGAVFGLIEGIILVSLVSSIGATLSFLSSRLLLRDALHTRYKERLARFDEGVARDGAFYLFSLRLVPVVPFFLVNLLAGLSQLKLRTFFLVSQIGMVPGTIAFVFAGTRLARIQSPSDVLSPGLIGAFVVLGLLPLLMRWLLRTLASRRIKKSHRRPCSFSDYLSAIGNSFKFAFGVVLGLGWRAEERRYFAVRCGLP